LGARKRGEMVFGDLFNAMIDPEQKGAKKLPKHLPDFAHAAANPELAVKMVLRKEHAAKAAWWKAHVRPARRARSHRCCGT
jgi:hypothetical protein